MKAVVKTMCAFPVIWVIKANKMAGPRLRAWMGAVLATLLIELAVDWVRAVMGL